MTSYEAGANVIAVVAIATGQNSVGLKADGETNGVFGFSKNGPLLHDLFAEDNWRSLRKRMRDEGAKEHHSDGLIWRG